MLCVKIDVYLVSCLGSSRLSAQVNTSSDESASYSYQLLNESPSATSSPRRAAHRSSDSTALLLDDASGSPDSTTPAWQGIFVPDEDMTLLSGGSSPASKNAAKGRLQRSVTDPADSSGAVFHASEPLAQQEVVFTQHESIPALTVQDLSEVVLSTSNPDVTFKRPSSLGMCECSEDDDSTRLDASPHWCSEATDNAACTALTTRTSTPICARLVPAVELDFRRQRTHLLSPVLVSSRSFVSGSPPHPLPLVTSWFATAALVFCSHRKFSMIIWNILQFLQNNIEKPDSNVFFR